VSQDFEAIEPMDSPVSAELETTEILSEATEEVLDQAVFSQEQGEAEAPVVASQEVKGVENVEAKSQDILGDSKEETVTLDPPSETQSEFKTPTTSAQGLGLGTVEGAGRLWKAPEVAEGSSKMVALDSKSGGLIKTQGVKKPASFESFVNSLSAKPKPVDSSSVSSETKVEAAEESVEAKGRSIKEDILKRMAKKYQNFDPKYFDLTSEGTEVAGDAKESDTVVNQGYEVSEAPETNGGASEGLIGQGEFLEPAATLAGQSEFVEAPPAEEISQVKGLAEDSESRMVGGAQIPLVSEESWPTQAGAIVSQVEDFESTGVMEPGMTLSTSYEDDEEPLVLLDQVVEDEEFEENELALSGEIGEETFMAEGPEEMAGEIVAENRESGNGPYADDSGHGETYVEDPYQDQVYDEDYYEESGYDGGEDEYEDIEPVQYALEPWPENFLGSDDQPVEFQLTTMENRLFKKMQNRSYLVPQGGSQGNWEAAKRTRLKGM
jgi:hypothetical protein